MEEAGKPGWGDTMKKKRGGEEEKQGRFHSRSESSQRASKQFFLNYCLASPGTDTSWLGSRAAAKTKSHNVAAATRNNETGMSVAEAAA